MHTSPSLQLQVPNYLQNLKWGVPFLELPVGIELRSYLLPQLRQSRKSFPVLFFGFEFYHEKLKFEKSPKFQKIYQNNNFKSEHAILFLRRQYPKNTISTRFCSGLAGNRFSSAKVSDQSSDPFKKFGRAKRAC